MVLHCATHIRKNNSGNGNTKNIYRTNCPWLGASMSFNWSTLSKKDCVEKSTQMCKYVSLGNWTVTNQLKDWWCYIISFVLLIVSYQLNYFKCIFSFQSYVASRRPWLQLWVPENSPPQRSPGRIFLYSVYWCDPTEQSSIGKNLKT